MKQLDGKPTKPLIAHEGPLGMGNWISEIPIAIHTHSEQHNLYVRVRSTGLRPQQRAQPATREFREQRNLEQVLRRAERGEEDVPRDAKVVKTLLKSTNIDHYEPRVVHQFLELWYPYVVDVLTDAHVYSEHAGKSTIDSDDVKLAIQSKVNFSFSQPPPREVLLELARNRNKIPLPKSIAGPETLISPNYQLAIPRKQSQPIEEIDNDDDNSVDPAPTPNPNPNVFQDQKDLLPGTPQRVSLPLGAKHPR